MLEREVAVIVAQEREISGGLELGRKVGSAGDLADEVGAPVHTDQRLRVLSLQTTGNVQREVAVDIVRRLGRRKNQPGRAVTQRVGEYSDIARTAQLRGLVVYAPTI